MKNQSVPRDERTLSVENASYRWGYIVLTFGLMAIILFRLIRYNETSWDLFALVTAGGLSSMAYQTFRGTFPRRSFIFFLILAAIGAAIILFAISMER